MPPITKFPSPVTPKPYEPKDTVYLATESAIISAGVGFLAALGRGSLRGGRTVFGELQRNARLIPLFAAVGTSYTLFESVSANLREKDSPLNGFIGGAFAGGIIGASIKNAGVPKVLGGAFFVAMLMGVSKWAGGIQGFGRKEAISNSSGDFVEIDKGDRQGFWDVVHRRPLSQTIDELGDLVKPHK